MTPEVLYRFFSKEEYAKGFVKGQIMISTLQSCRTQEGNGMDDREGEATVHLDELNFEERNEEVDRILKNTPAIFLGGSATNVKISNVRMVRHIHDANILCLTTHPNKYIKNNFGRFGVKITNPVELFSRIDKYFQENVIDYSGYRTRIVEYNEHIIDAKLLDPFDQIGFCKRRIPFSEEMEFRLLLLKEPPYDKMLINIGNLNDIVEYIEI